MLKIFGSRQEDQLQYEFLPSALEIAETPASPLGRTIVWIIFLILAIAILWAYLGKIDVVAVARGKVTPDGRLKVIQPFEEGIITAIHVNEGERVKKGQLLMELDATMKKVDKESIEQSINAMSLERDVLKKALIGGDITELVSEIELPERIKSDLIELNRSMNLEFKSKKNVLELEVVHSQSALEIEQSSVKKIESNIAMFKEKEKKLKTLVEANAIEVQQWEEVKDQITLAENELEIQKIKVAQAKNRLEEANKNLENLKNQRDTTILNLVVERNQKIAELEAELTKAQKSVKFQSLTSPVVGVVHGLASNTVGGVVTPAQPIMTIVPVGTPLVVEALLPNKDIGFVTENQEVAIKFDAFPFQKYGTIKGKVTSISPDAFEDEKMGSVYRIKIELDKKTIDVSGKEVNISPGMTVTAEIKTGKRRIIEFFLEPIIKYVDEGLKLR